MRFSLLTSQATPQPGEEFWLVAEFRPPPGAHIYWKNPGETGLATTVDFSTTAPIDISPPRYPGPQRFDGEAGTTSYGYGTPTALLARARVAAPLDGSAIVEARASWLSCREVCVKEQAATQIDLRTATPTDVAALLARLPIPNTSQVTGERIDHTQLRFTPTPGTVLHEFFPDPPLGPTDSDCVNQPQPDGSLRVDLRYGTNPGRPLSGLVRATWERAEHFIEVSVPAAQ